MTRLRQIHELFRVALGLDAGRVGALQDHRQEGRGKLDTIAQVGAALGVEPSHLDLVGGPDRLDHRQIGVAYLEDAIEAWLAERNSKPKPFRWTAKADTILAKNARARRVLEAAATGTK